MWQNLQHDILEAFADHQPCVVLSGASGFKIIQRSTTRRYRAAVVDNNGVEYASTAAAAKALGLSAGGISDMLHGKRKRVGAYTFTYL